MTPALTRLKMLEKINAARTNQGLTALRPQPRLHLIAEQHAAEMTAWGYFGLIAPDGLHWAKRVKAANVEYDHAWHLTHRLTGQILDSFQSMSAKHRAYLLEPKAQFIGLGSAMRGKKTVWVMYLTDVPNSSTLEAV